MMPFEIDRQKLNMVLNRMYDKDNKRAFYSTYFPENVVYVCVTVDEPRLPPKKGGILKNHTFMVHASGKITLSGPHYEYMREVYECFNAVMFKYVADSLRELAIGTTKLLHI